MTRALTLNADNVITEQAITALAEATIIVAAVTNISVSTIGSNKAVHLEPTGSPGLELADSSSSGDKPVTGFTTTSVAAAATTDVQIFGPLSGFTGLTPFTYYYHDPANPGDLTDLATNTAGEKMQRVGWALDSTTLVIEIEEPLERI